MISALSSAGPPSAGDAALLSSLTEARGDLAAATVDYRLTTTPDNGAAMDWAESSSGRGYLLVYKTAFDAYRFGASAPPGYSLGVPKGQPGIDSLITHESGHSIYSRNYGAGGRLLPNREILADDWVRTVWPGRF